MEVTTAAAAMAAKADSAAVLAADAAAMAASALSEHPVRSAETESCFSSREPKVDWREEY